MSVGGSTGDSENTTQIDPDFKKAWQGLNISAQRAAGLLGTNAPDAKVAEWTTDQKEAAHDIRQIAKLGIGETQTNQALGAAAKAADFRPRTIDNQQAKSFDAQAARMGDPALMRAASGGKAATVDAAELDLRRLGSVDPRMITETNLNKYMNPYEDQVVDQVTRQVGRARNIQRQADKADAIAAGAFGGSREGVARAQTNEAYDRNLTDQLASLNTGGFDRATGLAAADADRALQADSLNLQSRLAALGQNTGNQQQANLTNADNQMRASQFDAGLKQQADQANMAARNTMAMQDAANRQQTKLFNAGQDTQNSQFNAGQDLAAQQANQAAAAQGAGLNLQGAGVIGDLGQQKLDQAYQRTGAQMTLGGQIQGQKQQVFDTNTANQNADRAAVMQQLQALALPFGIMPGTGQGSTSSTNSTAKTMAAGG